MKLAAVLLISAVCAVEINASTPPFPSWGSSASKDFSVVVNMTAHDVVSTGASWWFEYIYSGGHASGDGKNVSIYRHRKGQRDEVCNKIKEGSDEPCITTHANDGYMYISFPTLENFCCKCSNKIGPVRYDWLQDGGGSFVGTSEVNGVQVDEFLKQGASDNHYYCTQDATQQGVRYMEHKNGKLKAMGFRFEQLRNGDAPERYV